MRKLFSQLGSVVIGISFFASALPVSAMCAAGVPLIGTVTSITNQGVSTKINIDHRGKYDASSLPLDRTDIDAYQRVVKAYVQNADVVPPNMKQQESSLAPQGYSSWDDYYSQNYTYISVPTDALSRAAYQLGDIVIVGPPGGAACTQYGFTGFFGKDGAIKSAIATDSGLLSYSFSGEALTLAVGADNSCVQTTSGTTCQVPITYTVRGNTFKVNPGESKQLDGARFSLLTLVSSTHTPLPQGMMIEDFTPRPLLHVLLFRAVATATTTATTTPTTATSTAPRDGESFLVSPTSGPASLQVTFGGKVSNGDPFSIDFGDRQQAATMRCPNSTSSSTSCILSPMTHTYSIPGTYTAILTDLIPCPTSGTGSNECQRQSRGVGTVTVVVSPAQPRQAFKAYPQSGPAPLAVDFYAPTDSYTYSIDFGDGAMPLSYWGPTSSASCKVRVGGPSGDRKSVV